MGRAPGGATEVCHATDPPYLTIDGADKALERPSGRPTSSVTRMRTGSLFHARMTIEGGTVIMSDDYLKDHGGRESRRFAIRRMMIADGSVPLGSAWRKDALLGACQKD